MLPRRPALVGWAACVVALLGACGDRDDDRASTDGDSSVLREVRVDTLVRTRSGLLGRPADLEFTSGGSLLVLDDLNARVYRLDETGTVEASFGRAGSGPGEFLRPQSLAPGRADTIWVVDAGNGRLQGFDGDGRTVAIFDASPWVAYPTHVTRDGHPISSTAGQDSALALVVDRGGRVVRRLGVSPAPFGGAAVRMSDLASEIADGRVPEVFRNTAFPMATDDAGVWLNRPVDALLEFYELSGGDLRLGPAATIELDEPELEGIRAAWIAENRAPESDGVSVLMYVSDLYASRNDAWVLLNQPAGSPAVLLRYDREGRRLGRWELPQASGARRLAVDLERGRVVLALPDVARIISLSLEDLGVRTD